MSALQGRGRRKRRRKRLLAACGRWPAVVGVSLLCLLVGWVLGLQGLWAGGGTFVGGEPVGRRKGKGAPGRRGYRCSVGGGGRGRVVPGPVDCRRLAERRRLRLKPGAGPSWRELVPARVLILAPSSSPD